MTHENKSGLIIIPPHKKKSRKVELKDIERVKEAYLPLEVFMNDLEATEAFKNVFAIAHQQVTKKDPLRFFVINANNKIVISENEKWDLPDYIIINPVITNHTKDLVSKSEGCLSFPGMPNNDVQRYNKIEVEFETINHKGDKLEKHHANCSGRLAQIFQHEIDHFDCKYIWQEMAGKK